MTQTIELDTQHMGWAAGMEWVRRHGLDPARVLIPNVLTLDPEARTVTVEHYSRLDSKGRTVVDASRNCIVTDPVTVQLESPPLPWPPAVAREV